MNWDKFTKTFKKELEKALDDVVSKDNLQDIGDDLAEEVVKRTRLGKGVDKSEGNQVKLKSLASSTKKSRGYKKKSGYLSAKTSPARSNLTESGDMLNSVKAKASEDNIEIDVSDKEADKAGYVSEDRPFLHLTKAQVRKTKEKIEDELVKKIKSNIK